MLTKSDMTIIKSTAPLVRKHGLEITQHMYKILFSKYPETKAMFKNANNQPEKLAAAIAAYAENIDQLNELSDAVERMAVSHVNASVKPHHYPMVADSLLTAIKDVLGDEIVTDKIQAAWTNAYNHLADILIAQENKIYSKHSA